MLLLDGQSQGQKDLTFGCHSAILSLLNAIKCQRGDTGQPGEFGLAQHFRFAHLLDVVLLIHQRERLVRESESPKVRIF